MELVGAVHDADLVTVFELAPGRIETGEPERTPGAREVGPDLDLHPGHPMDPMWCQLTSTWDSAERRRPPAVVGKA